MKRFALGLLAGVGILLSCCVAHAGVWETQFDGDDAIYFRDVMFVDADTGWAVGQYVIDSFSPPQ